MLKWISVQNGLPDQITIGQQLKYCRMRPWDGSDQYLVRTVSFEIPFLDFCSNFVQVYSRVRATRTNNKICGLAISTPQRRFGPIFWMQSARTVSRKIFTINWRKFLHFLNLHFIPNKQIGGFFLICLYIGVQTWYHQVRMLQNMWSGCR